MNIVIPSDAKSLIVFNTSLTNSGSSADVTSSNSNISGFKLSALAIATLCCCPPDNSSGYDFILSFKPTFSNNFTAFSSTSCLSLL